MRYIMTLDKGFAQQAGSAKRQAQQTEEMQNFRATIQKLRQSGDKMREKKAEEKLHEIKDKLDALSIQEYEIFQRYATMQVVNEQDLKLALRGLNEELQNRGILSAAEKISETEINTLASHMAKGLKEDTQLIVVFENFLNTSLERDQQGGRAYREQQVLVTKVALMNISIVGPAR